MTLVVLMQDNVLKDNILTETIPINILISTYTYFLAKVILNKDFDINAKNYTDSTLLSNVIRSNNIDILKFLLNNRKDLNVNLCKSMF
jgi:ankyrin repeat protein